MLEPRRLLTFREVARRGSFSRAAEALALTQPAVSQQVSALEREVGAPLLRRGPGGPSLTEAGALMLAHADALDARLRAADAQVAELAAGVPGRLAIGAFPSALATIVPAAIARRRAAEPDVTFEAREGSSAEVAAGVRDGSLHVGVCFEDAAAPPAEPPDVRRHELAAEAMDAAVGAGHLLRGARASGCRRSPATRGALRHAGTSSTGRASRPASSRGSSTSRATRSRSAASWPPASR